jgi:hypothetical protein
MRPLITLLAIAWLSAAVSGVVYLGRYVSTPGEENVAYPPAFPSESRLERDGNLPTLIFFAHPKCPCTRASLRELERLMTEIDGKVTANIVFIRPKDVTQEWTQTSLREAAEAIPNVRVVIDDEERETRLFNAQTSSLTLLYDRHGNLRFNGGITAARGHEGDNAGRRALFEIVTADAESARSPVFGCPLRQKDCHGELPGDTDHSRPER